MIADRVKETTTTMGTGTVNLAGAVTAFQAFVAGIGDGNTCYYCIQSLSSGEWEVGIGTVTDAAPDTLSRDTILQSSNSDNAVNFSAGTKDVFVPLPADKALYRDANGDVVVGKADGDKALFGAAGATDFSVQWDGNDAVFTITAGNFVFTGGNVGIGTASPEDTFTVNGNIRVIGNNAQILLRDSDSATQYILLRNVNGEGELRWDGGDLIFYEGGVSSTTHMVIQETTGNVGIGTVSPVTNLDVHGGFAANLVTKTGAYTATTSDHVILCDASGGAFTITLPAASGVTGIMYHVKKTDSSASAVTIDGNSTETIDGDQTIDLKLQYESVMIVSDGSNWHII